MSRVRSEESNIGDEREPHQRAEGSRRADLRIESETVDSDIRGISDKCWPEYGSEEKWIKGLLGMNIIRLLIS